MRVRILADDESRNHHPAVPTDATARLRQAGVAVDLHVYDGVSHGDYLFNLDTPECAEHYKELNAFLLNRLT